MHAICSISTGFAVIKDDDNGNILHVITFNEELPEIPRVWPNFNVGMAFQSIESQDPLNRIFKLEEIDEYPYSNVFLTMLHGRNTLSAIMLLDIILDQAKDEYLTQEELTETFKDAMLFLTENRIFEEIKTRYEKKRAASHACELNCDILNLATGRVKELFDIWPGFTK